MKLWQQYRDVITANWHVGFTAFGGPAVQFQTVILTILSKQVGLANVELVPREIRRKTGMG